MESDFRRPDPRRRGIARISRKGVSSLCILEHQRRAPRILASALRDVAAAVLANLLLVRSRCAQAFGRRVPRGEPAHRDRARAYRFLRRSSAERAWCARGRLARARSSFCRRHPRSAATRGNPVRLLILGATGPTGRNLVDQALGAGHEVTALARNASRLPVAHPHLAVVVGDATDARTLEDAMDGKDTVLSALGAGNSLRSQIASRAM